MSISPTAGIGGAGLSGGASIGGAGLSKTGGGGYVGPLDLVPGLGKVGWSQRALLAAWTDPVIAIRKSGGTTENFAATDEHEVDVSAVLAHLDGSAGFIATLFDQCGGGVNLVNAGPENQFNWSQAVNGGKPGIGGNGSGPDFLPRINSFEQSALFTWQSGDAFTYFYVFDFGVDDTGNSASGELYLEADSGNTVIGIYCAASSEIYLQTAEDFTSFSVDASRSDFNGRHILEVHFDAAGNLSVLLDGSAIGTTLTTGSVMPVPAITDGAVYITLPWETNGPPASDSWLHEAFILKDASAGQRLSVRQNLQAFFGTPALP